MKVIKEAKIPGYVCMKLKDEIDVVVTAF